MTHPAKPRRMSPPAARPLATEGVAFNPALPLLAAWDRLGESVQLWDIANRTQPTRLGTLKSTAVMTQALAFSPDGALLAAPTDQGTVRLWHVAEHTPPTSVGNIVTAEEQATAVAFGPRGRTLLVGDNIGSITTWDLTHPGRPVRKGTSTRHTGPVKGLAFHPSGTLAASAGLDGRIRLWDVSDPSRLVEVTSLSDGGLYAMATLVFSPDGRLLAVGGDRGIRLWSVDPTTILQRLCAQSAPITPEQWAQYLPDQPYDPPCA
jgi:WD40 repeat protein